MKPTAFLCALLLAFAACDAGPRIVVHASLGGRPVADLPVTLLPYDRDRLQDSLRREAGESAPGPTQEVLLELAGLDSALARVAPDSAGRARGDSLRRARTALAARIDTARAERREWDAALRLRADSLGRGAAAADERAPAADTTDASGRAALTASPGRSWIRASYVLPDAVLEWNVPVTLPAGQDSLRVALDERNGRRVTP